MGQSDHVTRRLARGYSIIAKNGCINVFQPCAHSWGLYKGYALIMCGGVQPFCDRNCEDKQPVPKSVGLAVVGAVRSFDRFGRPVGISDYI
jgi:hypothetical protein